MNDNLLKEWMTLIDFKITEGYDYMWDCYGDNAHGLDSDDFQTTQNYSVGIIFDTQTQLVYELTSYDYRENVAYRWINPYFKNKHDEEAKKISDSDIAYDDVKYQNMDTPNDFFVASTIILSKNK